MIGNILETRKTNVIIMDETLKIKDIQLEPLMDANNPLSPTVIPKPSNPEIEKLIVDDIMYRFRINKPQ